MVHCDVCQKPLLVKDDKGYCINCQVIEPQTRKLQDEILEGMTHSERSHRIAAFENNSLINEKLLRANFKNYIPQNEQQEKGKAYCERYAMNFNIEKPASLILYGPYGTGKSHLAKSITDVVIHTFHEAEKRYLTSLFVTAPKLLTVIKDSYRKDAKTSEYQILKAIRNVDLLVLDDIGAERTTVDEDRLSWAKKMIFQIIEERIGKHNVYTTNLSPAQLIKVYGERDASRILDTEDSFTFELKGENYRLRELRKRK